MFEIYVLCVLRPVFMAKKLIGKLKAGPQGQDHFGQNVSWHRINIQSPRVSYELEARVVSLVSIFISSRPTAHRSCATDKSELPTRADTFQSHCLVFGRRAFYYLRITCEGGFAHPTREKLIRYRWQKLSVRRR